MSNERFLRLIHAAIGFKKLDGFRYKILARELGVSKQLLSQYLQGDIAMPEQIQNKIIEILDLDREKLSKCGFPMYMENLRHVFFGDEEGNDI